jgi:hypothetical protein
MGYLLFHQNQYRREEMRKYLLGVMSAVTICLISASAQAEWYLGAHGGVSIASDTNPSYDVLNVNVPLGFDASYDTGYFLTVSSAMACQICQYALKVKSSH